MPRYQLLIRELGKDPRVVPVMQTLVVGRSRRADVVIEDEEVSREQFRIGLMGAMVFVEGIGKTNRTTVDGTAVDAGQRVTLIVGASIRIGRTVLQLQTGEPTENAPARPGSLDATIVAQGPATPRAVEPDAAPAPPPPAPPAPVPPAQEQTGGFRGPRDALPTPIMGPGANPAARKPETEAEDYGQTLNLKSGFRPGAAKTDPTPTPPTMPPTPPPPRPPGSAPPPKSDSGFGQTIEVKRGFRPGQAEPPPEVPGDPDGIGLTMNMPGGYRPGGAPPTPTPTPPPRPPAPPKPAAPEPRPPRTETPAPTPAPPPTPSPTPAPKPAADAARPKTVYVSPDQMVGRAAPVQPSTITPALAADVEGRLHQMLPRLFVKGDTIRRRVRLMKARTRIGRAETADVLLPNESVSELHAEIEFDGATWSLRDCGSTNGTLVNNEILRGRSAPIARNSLLGFGSLRGLFLCNDPASAAADRRDEERALKLLVSAGRLAKDVGKQVLAIARRDSNQTIAEILLGDTPIEPGDWANAIGAVKGRKTLLDRLRALFSRQPKPPAR